MVLLWLELNGLNSESMVYSRSAVIVVWSNIGSKLFCVFLLAGEWYIGGFATFFPSKVKLGLCSVNGLLSVCSLLVNFF